MASATKCFKKVGVSSGLGVEINAMAKIHTKNGVSAQEAFARAADELIATTVSDRAVLGLLVEENGGVLPDYQGALERERATP